MDTWLIFLLFIVIVILAVAIGQSWVMYLTLLLKPNSFQGGNENSNESGIGLNSVCDETINILDSFVIDNKLPNPTVAESLAEDISHDISIDIKKKLSTANSETKNMIAAKLIIDTMLHYYIYDRNPNTISQAAINSNVKNLRQLPTTCFDKNKINQLINTSADLVKSKKAVKVTLVARDCFRHEQIGISNGNVDQSVDENLNNELSRKNIEIRTLKEENKPLKDEIRLLKDENKLLRERQTSPLSSNLLLEDCTRERRELRDKVYEMKRDIERLTQEKLTQAHPNTSELDALRVRYEELRARNYELERNLSVVASAHNTEREQIVNLNAELNNCRQLLDEVLSAS